jgi:hypothetical protein
MIVINMHYIRQRHSLGGMSGAAALGCTVQGVARLAAKSVSSMKNLIFCTQQILNY